MKGSIHVYISHIDTHLCTGASRHVKMWPILFNLCVSEETKSCWTLLAESRDVKDPKKGNGNTLSIPLDSEIMIMSDLSQFEM